MNRKKAKIAVQEALDFLDQVGIEVTDETTFEDLGLNLDDVDIMLSFITEKYAFDFSDTDYHDVIYVEDLVDLVAAI
jgi:hypothetical protein